MITELMNKNDTFEIVRDKIALILAKEIQGQQNLAVTAGVNPVDYRARVFTEAVTPFQMFMNADGSNDDPTDESPIINVSFDSSSFDKRAGSTVNRQKSSTNYNIDCYGWGMAQAERCGGSTMGGTLANFAVQRALKIVRNILMSAEYVTLEMDGVVWDRWVDSITAFQPLIDNRPAINIVGARLAFNVNFNEFAEADYDYTSP
jgi:hypothetical protein